MSNAKSDNRFIAALKVLLAPKAGKTEITAPITIVEYVEPPSEEDAVKAYLTKDQTDILEADKAAVKENEDDHKEAVKQAKIAAAKAKLLADSAARVAKSTTMVSNALAKAEVAFLKELVETQNGLDRLATRGAAKDLVNARLEAMRNGRIYDMDIVAAHMGTDNNSAEQARQAAILLAGRNTATPVGGKSYTSNAGKGNGAGDNGEKPESRRAVAFKALKAAGLSTELANEVLNFTYDNKVDEYVQKLLADGKTDFLNKVSTIMMGENGSYAPRWKRALEANASPTAPVAPVTAAIFAAPSQTTTPATPPKPVVSNGDPVNS